MSVLAVRQGLPIYIAQAKQVDTLTGIPDNQPSKWFKGVSADGNPIVAFVLEFSNALVASGAQSPVANTNINDESILTIDVGDIGDLASNPVVRSSYISREGAELGELMAFDLPGRSYPQGAAHTFAGAGSFTDASTLIVPFGGAKMGAIRFTPPAITTVYAANVTITRSVTVFVVTAPIDDPMYFKETVSANLPQANGVSLIDQQPQEFNAQFSMLFAGPGVTQRVTSIFAYTSDGSVVADADTTMLTLATAASFRTTNSYSDSIMLSLFGRRLATYRVNLSATMAVRHLWLGDKITETQGSSQTVKQQASPTPSPVTPPNPAVAAKANATIPSGPVRR